MFFYKGKAKYIDEAIKMMESTKSDCIIVPGKYCIKSRGRRITSKAL